MTSIEYDKDLIDLLPPLPTIDELVTYYFEYCNWIYRHVNRPAFSSAWERFKSGTSADRITLATVCNIIAVAVHYLPPNHPLVSDLGETHEEMGRRFYEVMRTALTRHRAECKTYSLELVECLLIRCHYLTLSKTDSEEIWTVRGELISIGTAMGLHRDPLKWRMTKELAERRRWAWWHIILLERSALAIHITLVVELTSMQMAGIYVRQAHCNRIPPFRHSASLSKRSCSIPLRTTRISPKPCTLPARVHPRRHHGQCSIAAARAL